MGQLSLFKLPKLTTKEDDKNLLIKINGLANTDFDSLKNIGERIKIIHNNFVAFSGRVFTQDYALIQTEEELKKYIDICIKNDVVAVDTETSGLWFKTLKIVGLCLYTPGQKAVYIPINHQSYITFKTLKGQLSPEFVHSQMERLKEAKTKVIMHNSQFDMSVVKHQLGTFLECYWDTMTASFLINERERHNLKYQHFTYCNGEAGLYKFDELFDGLPFQFVPINEAYLYAARDAKMTYELYQYQKKQFETQEYLKSVYYVFRNIEMPVIPVIMEAEEVGFNLDLEKQKELSKKYHKLQDEVLVRLNKEVEKHLPEIERYNKYAKAYNDNIIKDVNNSEAFANGTFDKKKLLKQLEYPIKWSSSQQLQILFFDVLKYKIKKNRKNKGAKSTGKTVLATLAKTDLLPKLLLEWRSYEALLTKFIDKLNNCKAYVKEENKVYSSFNPLGADTGRLSSGNDKTGTPNFQNIPARGEAKEIRHMIKAPEGYFFLGGDFSQQEPRWVACLAGDESLIKAYENKKDLYSLVASFVFKVPYEQCLEFLPKDYDPEFVKSHNLVQMEDGTWYYPEGKKRRAKLKTTVMGILFKRGPATIAAEVGITLEEAQAIIDLIHQEFPRIPAWVKELEQEATKNGYLKTNWGRMRHFPDLQKPDFEIKPVADTIHISEETKQKYLTMLSKVKHWNQKLDIIREAWAEGIKITDNTMAKENEKRMLCNLKISGSSADQAKICINTIARDPILKNLGFRFICFIHDEVIGIIPKENARAAIPRFKTVIENAAPYTDPRVKCKSDLVLSTVWEKDNVISEYS